MIFDSLYGEFGAFIENTFDIANEAATSTAKDDKTLREYNIMNTYYPRIVQLMPKTERILMQHINKYRDKNVEILSSPFPLSAPLFAPADFDIVYKCTQIDKAEMEIMLRNVKLDDNLKAEPKNFKPFIVILILLMHYYAEKKDEEKLTLICRYAVYSMYWSVFKRSFRVFLPREETIIYTVNNLSNKFLLKQLASVDEWILSPVYNCMNTYRDNRLKICSDQDLYYLSGQFKTRFGNVFNIFAEKYYENYKNDNVVFTSTTMLDDMGTQRTQNSVTGDAESLAQSLTTEFFSNKPSQKLANYAGKMEKISPKELLVALMALQDSNDSAVVKKFYSALIYTYLNSGTDTTMDNIRTSKFLGVMANAYKKGNTKDPNISFIKDTLNEWLEKGSKTYRNSNRVATMNNLKKAMFTYFLMVIAMKGA